MTTTDRGKHDCHICGDNLPSYLSRCYRDDGNQEHWEASHCRDVLARRLADAEGEREAALRNHEEDKHAIVVACATILSAGGVSSDARSLQDAVEAVLAERDTLHAQLAEMERERDAEIARVVRITERLGVAEGEREAAEDALRQRGYRKSCDIPACNCGDVWAHGGHADDRVRELLDVFASGKTLLQSATDTIAERDTLRAQIAVAEKERDEQKSRWQALYDRPEFPTPDEVQACLRRIAFRDATIIDNAFMEGSVVMAAAKWSHDKAEREITTLRAQIERVRGVPTYNHDPSGGGTYQPYGTMDEAREAPVGSEYPGDWVRTANIITALAPESPSTEKSAPRCVYTIENDAYGACLGMRPACCPAEPDPFDAMEQPYCRYCGREIECTESPSTAEGRSDG